MKTIDARQLSDDVILEADVCIVGSGPSGFALAQRLSGTAHRVYVLESGSLEFDECLQERSRGDVIGEPYEPLDLCRVRRLGGSTGRRGWGGWCKTLWPDDFELRAHVPNSGWPVSFEEMKPHYRRAFATCGFAGVDSEKWFEKPDPQNGDVGVESAFIAPMKDFAQGWASLSETNSDNLTVILGATVTQICADRSPETVDTVEFTDNHRVLRLMPRILVLATGGIENARLLLLSDRTHVHGIGNSNDLVGRYFMEHPRFRWGHIETSGSGRNELVNLDPSEINRSDQELPPEIVMRMRRGLVLSKRRREREGLLNSRTWLQPVPKHGEGEGAMALREAGFWIAKGRRPPHLLQTLAVMGLHPIDTARALMFYKGPSHARLNARCFGFNSIFEQSPQPDSRVSLSRKTDEFGLRRAALDWRIDSTTWRTVEVTQSVLAEYLTRLGHHVRYEPNLVEDARKPPASWVRHHMGTTRMSTSPATGVVDENCRVFGMHNIFVVGSSVFPTGGNDMVTLTAIAIAHRLAGTLLDILSKFEAGVGAKRCVLQKP